MQMTVEAKKQTQWQRQLPNMNRIYLWRFPPEAHILYSFS